MENTEVKKENLTRHQKIAKSRGREWVGNVIKGKYEAKTKPTSLNYYRTIKKISQTALAKAINSSLSTYGAIERGKRACSLARVKALSLALRVPANEIFKQVKPGKYLANLASR